MTKFCIRLAVLACFLILTGNAHAEGFALYEYSARGVALGGSVMARKPDASAVAYNPALMTRLPGIHIMGGLSAITPDGKMRSTDAFGDTALKRLGKASSVAEIKAAYALVRDMGCFDVSYNFFKNPPGQTVRAALAMLGFIFKVRREMGKKAHFELNSIRIEPHTALARRAVAWLTTPRTTGPHHP